MNNCKNCMRIAPFDEKTEYCPYYLYSREKMEEFCKDSSFNCEAYIYFDNEILNTKNEKNHCNFESKELGRQLKECPFCGSHLIFHYDSYPNKYGNLVKLVYYLHDPDVKCVLNEAIAGVFDLPAPDERDGYLGECPNLWNERI